MATTSLKLPDELKQRVNALAALANKSPHAFMLEAIEQEARRGEKYQQFLAQAETSWQEYQSNGVAFAAEDVHAYVRARLKGENPPQLMPVSS